MDFLDPTKKRAHTIRLFIGYILMGVALIMATLILVYQSFGYDFDPRTGTVIQNGLIFISARPESAEIYLNGQLHKSRTDTRLVVPAGQYTVRLQRDGYRPWNQTINLEGGSIERLVYPILFPETLKLEDIELYGSQPAFATQSPDRRWLLVQKPGSLESFDVFDLANPLQPPAAVSIPPAALTSSRESQSIKTVEWSTDNRHVLLEHQFGANREFIMFDREAPANTINLNATFNINPDQVALRDKRFDSYYFLNLGPGTLQLADLRNRTLSPLLTQVRAFKPYGDNMLLYATTEAAPAGKVLLKLRENDASYTIREAGLNGPYLMDMARFDGAWYVVVSASDEGRVYVYKNPLDTLKGSNKDPLVPVTVLKIDNPKHVLFSANTRFVMAQNGSKFGVYDSEADRRYFYDIKLPVPPAQKAQWMDGHRIMLTHDGKSVVFDFNGTNQQTLTAAVLENGIFFDRDYTRLFNVAPSVSVAGRFALTMTELRVTAD